MPRRLLAAVLAACLVPLVVAAQDDNPFKNVKVGDFATYKTVTTLGVVAVEGTETRTVVAKSDKEVTLLISNTFQNEQLPPRTQKLDLTKPYDPRQIGESPPGVEDKAQKLKAGRKKIKVANKEYDCTWTTYKVMGKDRGTDFEFDLKVWMSGDFPMGLAREETRGNFKGQTLTTSREVIEWGNKPLKEGTGQPPR